LELKKKQQEILDEAIVLLKQKGYSAMSMRDLASALGMRAASLYAHLNSKEQILEWICFGLAADFFDALNDARNSGLKDEQLLVYFVKKHLEVVLKNPDITGIYANEWRHLDGRLDEFVELRRQYETEVRELLITVLPSVASSAGSAGFSTKYLLYTLNSSYLWFRKQDSGKTRKVKAVVEKVLYGLVGSKG